MTTVAPTLHDLENAVLDLPRNDRSRIAKRILTSLEDDAGTEISDAWKAEIGRRVEAMENGEPGVDHQTVTERARAAVAEVRDGRGS